MWTVHRFEHVTVNVSGAHQVGQFGTRASLICEFFHEVTFNEWRILTVLIVWEMSRCAVQIQFSDVGREHLVVALSAQMMRDEILQLLSNDSTAWCPENEPLTDFFVNMEQLQIFAKFSMVA